MHFHWLVSYQPIHGRKREKGKKVLLGNVREKLPNIVVMNGLDYLASHKPSQRRIFNPSNRQSNRLYPCYHQHLIRNAVSVVMNSQTGS